MATNLSPITFGNKITSIPKVNTPVFCIFLEMKQKRIHNLAKLLPLDENSSNSQEDEYKIDFQGA